MGKTRRQRETSHLSSNPDGSSSPLFLEWNMSSDDEADYLPPNIARLSNSYDNIFEGIDIYEVLAAKPDSGGNAKTSNETNNLEASLALQPQSNVLEGVSENLTYDFSVEIDDDERSTISVSKRVFKNRGASKEERRKLRHETFIEKINAIQDMKMKQNKKINKMFLANEEPSTSADNTKISMPQESAKTMAMKQEQIVKSQARYKRMLKDIAVFTKLWENPEYKADPTGFVSETVKERLTKETE